MTTQTTHADHKHNLAPKWARLGVLLNTRPSRSTPDLERLLLDTAHHCPLDPRLFILAVTWLRYFDIYVAAHRLKQLALTELEPKEQAVLALLLDTAVEHGGSRSLVRTVTNDLKPADPAGPLFEIDRGDLADLIRGEATKASHRWGLWVQPIELKPDALRPSSWIAQHNPDLRSRASHKGDLRSSILEVLKRDLKGEEVSESELARRCGSTNVATRDALQDLELEVPQLRIERRRGRGGSCVSLSDVA